jgi:hypothetical protein
MSSQWNNMCPRSLLRSFIRLADSSAMLTISNRTRLNQNSTTNNRKVDLYISRPSNAFITDKWGGGVEIK